MTPITPNRRAVLAGAAASTLMANEAFAAPPAAVFANGCGVVIHNITEAQLDLAHDCGFTHVRTDLFWHRVETRRDIFDWRDFDRQMAAMHERGIRPLLILDYGNELHADPSILGPHALPGFLRYVREAVERYKQYDPIWEIWNEPNHERFWGSAPSARDYVRLVHESARVIRGVDAGATIAGGSVSGIGAETIDFLEQCLIDGMDRSIDVLTVHPYGSVYPPEAVLSAYAGLGTMLQRRGGRPPVPFANSELGYPALNELSDLEMHADYCTRFVVLDAVAGARFTTLYKLQDGGDPSDRYENAYGLYRADGSAKPAAAALKGLLAALKGKRYARRLPSDPDVFAFVFEGGHGGSVIAYWTNGAARPATVAGRRLDLRTRPQITGL